MIYFVNTWFTVFEKAPKPPSNPPNPVPMSTVTGHANLIEVLEERVQSLFAEGQLEDAVRIAQTALDAARRSTSSDPSNAPALVSALEVVGDIRRAQGLFSESESLYLEALDVADQVIGSIPAEQVARVQGSLATVYDNSQLYDKAIPLYETALEIYRELGNDFEDSAGKLGNNLAMLYKEEGRYDDAEQTYAYAAQAFERANGKESEEAAAVYNNLGGLYQETGFPEQAREMHKIALAIRESIFPDTQPEIAQSLCNLAAVSHRLHEFRAATENYEKALKIFERNLPAERDNFAITSENLAALHRDLKQDKKAAALEKRVTKALKKVS